MLLIFHLLLLGQLSPGRCCLCPCLPSRDEPLAERRERKAKGEEGKPSQEAPGPWPSLDPQPRVTEHLRSAGPAQPPCERIAQQPDRGGGIRRRRSLPPGVLCNQHLENSWKEEEDCVLSVYMCFLTFRQIRSVVYVCVFVFPRHYWRILCASACGRRVSPAGPQRSERVQSRGLCLRIKTPPLGARTLVLGWNCQNEEPQTHRRANAQDGWTLSKNSKDKLTVESE